MNIKIASILKNGNDPIFRIENNIQDIIEDILNTEKLDVETIKILAVLQEDRKIYTSEMIELINHFRRKQGLTDVKRQNIYQLSKHSEFMKDKMGKDGNRAYIMESDLRNYILFSLDPKLLGFYSYPDVLDIVNQQLDKGKEIKDTNFVAQHYNNSDNFKKLSGGRKINNKLFLTKEEVNEFLKFKKLKPIK